MNNLHYGLSPELPRETQPFPCRGLATNHRLGKYLDTWSLGLPSPKLCAD